MAQDGIELITRLEAELRRRGEYTHISCNLDNPSLMHINMGGKVKADSSGKLVLLNNVNIHITENADSVNVRGELFGSNFPKDKHLQALELVNELNRDIWFCKFVLREAMNEYYVVLDTDGLLSPATDLAECLVKLEVFENTYVLAQPYVSVRAASEL
jgi:hypothetical protein